MYIIIIIKGWSLTREGFHLGGSSIKPPPFSHTHPFSLFLWLHAPFSLCEEGERITEREGVRERERKKGRKQREWERGRGKDRERGSERQRVRKWREEKGRVGTDRDKARKELLGRERKSERGGGEGGHRQRMSSWGVRETERGGGRKKRLPASPIQVCC